MNLDSFFDRLAELLSSDALNQVLLVLGFVLVLLFVYWIV